MAFGVVLAVLVGHASLLAAQNTDSLAALLGSSSITTRQRAIAGLRAIPPAVWSEMARTVLFAELVSEGRYSPRSTASDYEEPAEARGGYQIELVEAALALNDSRSIEGMVWLGLQTHGGAIDFIAARGETAVPFLVEAWSTNSWRRPDILETATEILDHRAGVSGEARTRLTRIQLDASGFEWSLSPSVQRHPEFVTIVKFAADSGGDEIQRSMARSVLPGLLVQLSSTSPAQLWASERPFAAAVCPDQDQGRCVQLQNLWSTIDGHIRGARWTAAENGINAFLKAAGPICSGTIQSNACRTLIGNALAVRSRIND